MCNRDAFTLSHWARNACFRSYDPNRRISTPLFGPAQKLVPYETYPSHHPRASGSRPSDDGYNRRKQFERAFDGMGRKAEDGKAEGLHLIATELPRSKLAVAIDACVPDRVEHKSRD